MMKIDTDNVNREDFHVERRRIDAADLPVTLIRPRKLKHHWTPDELCLRSLLLRGHGRDGEVISAGFPKFFNHRENLAATAEAEALIGAGRATFTTKLDGSLVVRSEIDGWVHLRTRGNHELGEFGWVREFIEREHPDVLVPLRGEDADRSHLFEMTAPNNQIVVRYDKPQLTYLGYVYHGDLKPRLRPSPFSTPNVERHPVNESLRDMQGHPITKADLARTWNELPASIATPQFKPSAEASPETRAVASIAATVDALKGEEGVVAWCERHDGTCILQKFKSMWYLRANALKSFATVERIRDYVYTNKIRTEVGFTESLMRDGIDYEHAVMQLPLFDEVMKAQEVRTARLDGAQATIGKPAPGTSRKDLAIGLKCHYLVAEDMFAPMLYWALGEEERAQKARTAYILGISTTALARLDAAGASESKLVLDLEAARVQE